MTDKICSGVYVVQRIPLYKQVWLKEQGDAVYDSVSVERKENSKENLDPRQPLPCQDKTESTDFLGAIGALSAQSVPRKDVDLGHIILENVLSNFHSNIFQKCPN